MKRLNFLCAILLSPLWLTSCGTTIDAYDGPTRSDDELAHLSNRGVVIIQLSGGIGGNVIYPEPVTKTDILEGGIPRYIGNNFLHLKLLPGQYQITYAAWGQKAWPVIRSDVVDLREGHNYVARSDWWWLNGPTCVYPTTTLSGYYCQSIWIEDETTGEVVSGARSEPGPRCRTANFDSCYDLTFRRELIR